MNSVQECPGDIAPKIAPANWKRYIRVNDVRACPLTRGDYNKLRGWEIPANENPDDDGYVIVYRWGEPNQYMSWCSKAEFDAVSRPSTGMTFGHAIEAMKRGFKVARKEWDGKGMYIWHTPYSIVSDCQNITDPYLKDISDANGGTVRFLSSIRMKTATGEVLTGWLASQTDMLSEDWYLIAETDEPTEGR